MFYVYYHRRLSDDKIFYVGKGSGKRAWSTSGRSEAWFKIANEYGWRVETLGNFMIEGLALALEATAIRIFLNSPGSILVNTVLPPFPKIPLLDEVNLNEDQP